MPIDLGMFADKFRRYCAQLEVTLAEIAQSTGISVERLKALTDQKAEPSADEVLILADFFKCDYKFFISNEKLASFEQTESLFRMHGSTLNREDRWAIQEFLYLCDCQEYLLANLLNTKRRRFSFRKRGTFYKKHAQDAAIALRRHLGFQPNEVARDIFKNFREIGIHVFRRKLGQSAISGLFVRHPVAGLCTLVNYSEDVFRQRFTAAHEAAHAILDDEADFIVSFSNWDTKDLSEIRANTFASHFLMPPEFLKAIPNPSIWDHMKLAEWSVRLMVNPEPLVYALKEAGLLNNDQVASLRDTKIPRELKGDPELPESLSPRTRIRKEELLQRGLSESYVALCFDGYEAGLVSAGRLGEILLVPEPELNEIAALYGRKLLHGD